ncbi:hypothetical protein IFM89_007810 [Coptis chinensis]|uniref:Helicase ATP-binding domain-containing protein n=1 Tax=Coptis chinensis TaxID=261450 RepID=A0A835MC20_9MAGN|nr:hypothetical protein IFM89_007810 [Coptis chinensis]
MKKRHINEISPDQWEKHSFNPSRILNKNSPPPPIESFSYRPKNGEISTGIKESLEDDDVDDVEEIRPHRNRGRRFIISEDSDDDDDDVEVCEIKSSSEVEIFSVDDSDDDCDDVEVEVEVDENNKNDVVGMALRKCSKISEELRKELYGSSMCNCDRYAEVENSSVRIVTQEDINAACEIEESDFQPVLKPYQLVGVNFLLLLHRKNVAGAILADEMGLGKTIQAITYLTLLKHLDNDPGPHLIVCPASLLENWERELKKWCPSFSVLQFHGAGRVAHLKVLTSFAKSGRRPPFNVLLVCYSLFERHSAQQKDDRKILKRCRWSCVLMDEAHALKDKNSYRWKNLMSVAQNANQRLMLTGAATPK